MALLSLLLILCSFYSTIASYGGYSALNYTTNDIGNSFFNRTLVTRTNFLDGLTNNDTLIENNKWKIKPTSDYKYQWALQVCFVHCASPPRTQYTYTMIIPKAFIGSQLAFNPAPPSWGFHPSSPSTIRFTIYGSSDTQQTGDRDILISIANGDWNAPNTIRSISALISLDAPTSDAFNNKIFPTCLGGNLAKGNPRTIDGSGGGERWQVVMGETHIANLNSWTPVHGTDGTPWPLTFEVENYPAFNRSVVRLITSDYTQSCEFDEAFPNADRGLDVYINGGRSAKVIKIVKFEFEHFWNETADPTLSPTHNPSAAPTTPEPTKEPTPAPTVSPSPNPTKEPTTATPSKAPTRHPTTIPTKAPSSDPTENPSLIPTIQPTTDPTIDPTQDPTQDPTEVPTADPTIDPTEDPTSDPTADPTIDPTADPTEDPTIDPTADPTIDPTADPTQDPTNDPTADPTIDPTEDPTIDPTTDPTAYPTQAPSLAPTNSPITCPDYNKFSPINTDGSAYSPIDGLDILIDIDEIINSTVVQMSTSSEIVPIIDHGACKSSKFDCNYRCNNTNGCDYSCGGSASCFDFSLNCTSATGCNLHCTAEYSCGVQTIARVDGSEHGTTAFHLDCQEKQSCEGVTVNVHAAASAHIHCRKHRACKDVVIKFTGISSENNTNTSIRCYEAGACDNLYIEADGPLTKLHMYEYSAGVVLNNGYGWSAMLRICFHHIFIPHILNIHRDNTITCDLRSKFVKYEYESSNLDSLARDEYDMYDDDLRYLPCEDIIVQCINPKNNNPSNCTMTYVFQTEGVFDAFIREAQRTDPSEHCVYVSIEDTLAALQCQGECAGSPTMLPTTSPSPAPSNAPSLAPSLAPSKAPSGSPSQPPTQAPSFSPSAAPTLAPSRSPSNAPSFSPSNAPSSAPSFSPSMAPSFSPTQSPTRFPSDGSKLELFLFHTFVVYRFINMTDDNYNLILNYTENNVIAIMQQLIEEGYFGEDGTGIGASYSNFEITVLRINGKSITGDVITRADLSLVVNNTNEMHVRVKIDHEEDYLDFFKNQRSTSEEFEIDCTGRFQNYFENDGFIFKVANSSDIDYEKDNPPDRSINYVFWALNGFLIASILIGILAKVHNEMGDKITMIPPVDNANYIAVMFYGLQIYDVVSDINLTSEILAAIANRECEDMDTEAYCARDGNPEATDNLEATDTLHEYALLASGIMSVVFLLVPYALNVAYAAKVPNSQIIQNNSSARTWFEQRQSMFITLVVFSGGCYPALALCSSNLFGIPLLNCGLSSFELTALSDIRVITTVLTENGPQMLVQLLFSFSVNEFTTNTQLAFATSIFSIIGSVLNYFINRDKKGTAKDVYYYYEVKLKKKNGKLSKDQKKCIKARRGIKRALAKEIVTKVYTDIDIANIEIGFVTIRATNFVIRVAQHVFETELSDKPPTYEELRKIKRRKGREEEAMRPYKAYCHDLYQNNRQEMTGLIFHHYHGLNKSKFSLRYCQEYPKERNHDKLLNKSVYKDLIGQNHKQLSTNLDELDLDELNGLTTFGAGANTDGYMDTAEREEQHERLKRIRKYKDLERKGKTNPTQELQNYRTQLADGNAIIVKELERLKKEKKGKLILGTAQIGDFISKLKYNGINGAVIEDILQYQTTVGLFANDQDGNDDSDSASNSSLVYDSDGKVVTDRQQIIKRKIIKREENNEFPMYPEWFPDKSHFPKEDKRKNKNIDYINDPNWVENNNFGFWKPPENGKQQHKDDKERTWVDPVPPHLIDWDEGVQETKKKKKKKGMFKGMFKKKKKETKTEKSSEEEAFSEWNFENGNIPNYPPREFRRNSGEIDGNDTKRKRKRKKKKKAKDDTNNWSPVHTSDGFKY